MVTSFHLNVACIAHAGSVALYRPRSVRKQVADITACRAVSPDCCGAAGVQSGAAAQAACGARRWLARNAAGVKVIRSQTVAAAAVCSSLVACLPALEHVELRLPGALCPGALGCLLQGLAMCPRLRALDLRVVDPATDVDDMAYQVFAGPGMPSFAELRGLTKLDLSFGGADPFTIEALVDGLMSLTGLVHLSVSRPQMSVLPASLGQLKGLRTLRFSDLNPCELPETGCFDLPNLQSLDFRECTFFDVEELPGVGALQSLTRIEFSRCYGGPWFFDRQLVQIPGLQRMVFDNSEYCRGGACQWLSCPTADLGPLRLKLLHLSFRGHKLAHFPLALTQLGALECLNAEGNECAELPAGIAALSRLTELTLGRAGLHMADPPADEWESCSGCARFGRSLRLPGALQASLQLL